MKPPTVVSTTPPEAIPRTQILPETRRSQRSPSSSGQKNRQPEGIRETSAKTSAVKSRDNPLTAARVYHLIRAAEQTEGKDKKKQLFVSRIPGGEKKKPKDKFLRQKLSIKV